jgi:metallophosphoesterase superfamily enzyme
MQKLADNAAAMETFRAFLKVIVEEGALLVLPPFSSLSSGQTLSRERF